MRLKVAVADEPHDVLAGEPKPIRGLLGRKSSCSSASVTATRLPSPSIRSISSASAPEQRATLCDMRTVTHREMRNQSGDILRHVANGETIQVTNRGRVAALIVPPGTDPLADLVSRGQVRVARNPTSNLRLIVRLKGTADSQAIVADVRGRW